MFSGMLWECFRSDLMIIVQAKGQRHVALTFKFLRIQIEYELTFLQSLARTISSRPFIIGRSRRSHPNTTTLAVSVKLIPALHIICAERYSTELYSAERNNPLSRFSTFAPSFRPPCRLRIQALKKLLVIFVDISVRTWPTFVAEEQL